MRSAWFKRRFYAALHLWYRRLFPTRVARGAHVGPGAQRILVVRNDRIGDLILTTPAIDVLHALAPGAEIDVLASPANARLLAHDGRVTTVHVHGGTWRGLVGLRRALRARHYDATFSFIPGRSIQQGVAAGMAAHGDTVRVSVWRPKRYHGLFTHVVRVPFALRAGPVSAQLVHVVRTAFGAPTGAPAGGMVPRPSLAIPHTAHHAVANFIEQHALGTFIVVNLWSAAAARSWSAGECVRALVLLAERHPTWAYVLVPAPAHAAAAERVRALGPAGRVFVYPPAAPLLELAALTQRAALMVTPNTMTLHIAVATGRPVVWLDTTTDRNDPQLWRPTGVPARGLIASAGEPAGTIAGHLVAAAVESLATEAGVRG